MRPTAYSAAEETAHRAVATALCIYEMPSSLPEAASLSHFLKLLTDYRAVEAIDSDACLAVGRRGDRRRVKPIAFLPFYYELIVKTVMDAAICAGSALGL